MVLLKRTKNTNKPLIKQILDLVALYIFSIYNKIKKR